MGIYAYRLGHQITKTSLVSRFFIPLFSVLFLACLLLAAPSGPLRQWKSEPILWGIGFSALCVWQSTRPSRWCANLFFQYLGERSYSLYLLHPVVLILFKSSLQNVYSTLTPQFGAYAFFVCAALVLLPLLVLSELTYRLIEVPGIEFGRRINFRIRHRASISEPIVPDRKLL
jgi:peptidoglycan/LPS O-acetylase OafA/YrhL